MIVLMGIKHSGKTSIGKLLSKTLNLPFQDLDILLEEQFSKERKLNFRELYLKLGEFGFRELETAAITNTLIHKKGILALGGGTIDNPQAIKIAKEADILVFLDVKESILYQRIKKNGFPSFLEKSPEKLFHELFLRRRLLYKDIATITINITDEKSEEILDILIKKLEENQ
ncbi:MAG: shikimate kinase [Gammaproteobacteria bacterium]|nr:shikimate kinase [Gammaproteobacteria bacterium]